MTETEKNELRVKVAELCGWKFLKQGVYVRTYPPGTSVEKIDALEGMPKDAYLIPSDRHNARLEACKRNAPDYPNDLNACAEFEKGLSGIDWDEKGLSSFMKYYAALCAECDMRPEQMIFATATQRCQAFVNVMEEKR